MKIILEIPNTIFKIIDLQTLEIIMRSKKIKLKMAIMEEREQEVTNIYQMSNL